MSEINIDLFKRNTNIFDDTYDCIDVEVEDCQIEVNTEPQDIVIEISGLTTINRFIGLDDTPLYYEDGKFFKVKHNKIIYADLQWNDIKGDIKSNKDLIEQIDKAVEEYSKSFDIQIILDIVEKHNLDIFSHPYLRELIQKNYNTLNKKIDDINTYLSQEIENLQIDVNNKYNQLETEISSLDQKLSKDINDLDIKLSGQIDDLIQDLSDEITNRENADTEIKNSVTNLDEKVDGINVNLTKQIDDLEQDVNNKYNELVRDIDDLTDVVEEDYETLNQRITDVADEINQTIEDNVVALQQEDTVLQNQINTHSQELTAHDTRITNNTNTITQEITDRQNADNELQEQIDGITAGADVRDIIGTYADLQTYDKSTLGDNDIIKVLNDETKENASTYYRFSTTTQSFLYIGKEGPFYTKSETNATFVPQTRTINGYDLSENRSLTYSDVNALPNTITKLSDFTDDLGDTPIHTHNQYIEATNLETELKNYGTDLDYTDTTLSLLNNEGNTLSSVTIKSTPDLDNKTISLNSNSELQSIGSVLQSGGYQKYWCGTKAEYDAIVAKDNDTLYEVLDEVNDIVTEIPTATVDEIGLCKPDGVTITIDDTGVLSANNSALLNHNISNIAHTDLFSAKANINLNNVSSNIDWITTRVIYGGGESGYELSRLGWIRQWGKVTSSVNGEVEFTLHRPYLNTTFSIYANVNELGNYFLSIYPSGNQKFKLRVQTAQGNNIAVHVAWQSYGRFN